MIAQMRSMLKSGAGRNGVKNQDDASHAQRKHERNFDEQARRLPVGEAAAATLIPQGSGHGTSAALLVAACLQQGRAASEAARLQNKRGPPPRPATRGGAAAESIRRGLCGGGGLPPAGTKSGRRVPACLST